MESPSFFKQYSCLKLLHQSKNSKVFAAVEDITNRQVSIKLHNNDFPSKKQLNKFAKEYQVGKLFSADPKILQYYAFEQCGYGNAIIMEEFGESLCDYLQKHELTLPQTLQVAIQLAEALHSILEKEIIHTRIDLNHILVKNTRNEQGVEYLSAKLSDFGFCTELAKERPSTTHSDIDLRFASPEQTGRMNRDIDYRTDFYSLGIVMYRLLAGFLPFTSSDPLELVYQHLAVKPKSLNDINPRVPLVVSQIVDTLLEKSAENRYKSPSGLRYDLQQCLYQLQQNNSIIHFRLQQQDISSKLTLQQKLYGREMEITRLLQGVEQILSGETARMTIFVGGYSGIGKTSLINEVNKPLTREKGYFISGKELQRRSVPYASLIQAFQQLVKVLLTEGEERLAYWKQKIHTALGNRGQVIVDVIPEVELIIGPQPPVEPLTAQENDVRFTMVLKSFIEVFAQKEHPLVLFIDDMQWSDINTFKLIEHLMTTSEMGHLLLLIAYRENEVSESHPLTLLRLALEKQCCAIMRISLLPLQTNSVFQIVQDAMGLGSEQASALADVIIQKTGGNPFFVNQLLKYCDSEKLIKFNFQTLKWDVDLMKIKSHSASDNILDMLIEKFHKLSPENSRILSMAACLGSTFNLEVLSLVCDKSKQEVSEALWPSIKEGFLMQHDEDFKWLGKLENVEISFMHDKIQQVSYDLLSAEEKAAFHLKIGRAKVQYFSSTKVELHIFRILSQFKLARQLLQDPKEKTHIAQLCLRASIKAKQCSAFHSAAEYASFGIELLSEDCWDKQYDLTLKLYEQLCESEHLRGNYEGSAKLYPYVLSKCRTIFDKTTIYSIQANEYEGQQKFGECIKIVLSALKQFGVEVNTEPAGVQQSIKEELAKLTVMMNGKDVDDLFDLAETTDMNHITVMRLLVSLWAATFCSGNIGLFFLISAMVTRYTLEHGQTTYSAQAYVSYSFVVHSIMKDAILADKFGRLGLKLVDKYSSKTVKHRAAFMYYPNVYSFLNHPFSVSKHMEEAHKQSLEYGDILFGGYTAHMILCFRFYSSVLIEGSDPLLPFLGKANVFLHRFCYFLVFLANFWLIEFPFKDEKKMLQEAIECNDVMSIAGYACGEITRSYWSRDIDSWKHVAETGYEKSHELLGGTFHIIEADLFAGLMFLHLYPQASPEEQERYLSKISAIISNFEALAKNAQQFEHKLLLLKAERARVMGENSDVVLQYFDAAVSSAHELGFTQFEALGNELQARYWLTKSKSRYALSHVQSAFYMYDLWGAKAKVRQLMKEFPSLTKGLTPTHAVISDEVELTNLDTQTVIKATQASSKQKSLQELLSNMIKIILENTAANKAVMMLSEPGEKLLVLADSEGNTVISSICKAIPVDQYDNLPKSIINYVARTKEIVIIDDLSASTQHNSDLYLTTHTNVASIMCIPIMKQNKFQGMIYLESNNMTNVFNLERANVIALLGIQVILHLENSQFTAVLESERRFKKLSVELEETKKRLEEFIDTLCHELRNPMNGISGNQTILQEVHRAVVSICKDKQPSKEELADKVLNQMALFQDSVQAISISSDHLKDIVDTVLTVSMLENNSVKLQEIPFYPDDVIPQVSTMFKAKLNEKQLVLKVDVPEERVKVIGDPYRLKEILINLLSNAIKFTQNGSISLRMLILARTEQSLTLKFEVEDTGIGMTEQEQHKLFRSFSQANSTTNSTFGGYGLGLKICKDLVTLMGGEISVESIKGVKTRFQFTIQCRLVHEATLEDQASQQSPRVQGSTSTSTIVQPKENSSVPSSSTALPSYNVLIVEDNAINQKVLNQMLKLLNQRCFTALNGQEAIDIYQKHTSTTGMPQIDFVFMDIQMPVMNGVEATQNIRRYEQSNALPPVPIVGVSANTRDEHINTAISSGMNGYVTKPYKKNDIFSALETFGKR